MRLKLDSKRPTCVGTGLLTLDLVVRGELSMPERTAAGGTCANVLAILASLGWDARPLGRLGNDEAGRRFERDLRASGARTDGLVFSSRIATPCVVERYGLPDHRFERGCPLCGKPLPGFRPTPTPTLTHLLGRSAPLVFLLDRATSGGYRVARKAKRKGAVVVFEPLWWEETPVFGRCLRLADIVKLAPMATPTTVDARLEQAPLLIETFGGEGLRYRRRGFRGVDQEWRTRAASPVGRWVDSCGSGDWLTAGFLHALFTEAATVDAALGFGQDLAARNCGFPGARGMLTQRPESEPNPCAFHL